MVECRVDEDAGVVPSAGLDADSLMDQCVRSEVLACNSDRCARRIVSITTGAIK